MVRIRGLFLPLTTPPAPHHAHQLLPYPLPRGFAGNSALAQPRPLNWPPPKRRGLSAHTACIHLGVPTLFW